MTELEILFSSGQGILVQMEDREAALRFMQQAMEYNRDNEQGLYHLSTDYEEILIDLGDISFVRLRKENHPRIGATLKIPAQTSFHDKVPGADARQQAAQAAEQPGEPRHFTVDPQGNVAEDPVVKKFEQAEARIRQAEARLDQMEVQKRKLEADLRKSSEELEDAVKEADLRKAIEGIEIDGELKQMKRQQADG